MSAIDRLVKAVGYPSDEVSSDAGATVLAVDGRRIRVVDVRGRLVLSLALGSQSDEGLRQLAAYAAGRMLREEATLAWEPDRRELILWQAVPATAGDELLRRVFEVFCASCDWWAERTGETTQAVPEMVIRG